MKNLILLLIIPAIGLSNGFISGRISDQQNQPLAFATVVLYKSDSSLVNGAVTNELGNFIFESVPEGTYYLEIDFLGYEKKVITEIILDKSGNKIVLDPILLEPDSNVLDEINISVDQFYIQNKIDRKVIQVGQNLNAANGDLGDVLDNIPSFGTGASGVISFRGSQNYQVLIDGKPSGLTGSEALQNIPAASVKEIEILTNPSARYLANSEAGIINVILKKGMKNGLSGQVGAGFNYHDKGNFIGDVNANLHFKTEKLRFYLQAFGSQDSIQLDGTTEVLIQGEDYRFDRHRTARQLRWASSFNGQAGLDFLLSDRHTLSLWSSFNTRYSDYMALNNDADIETELPVTWGSLIYQNKYTGNQWQLTVEDKIEFKNGSFQILADYSKAGNSRDNFRNYFITDSLFLFFAEQEDSTQFYQNENRDRWHTEINYSHTASDSSIIELGFLHEFYTRENTFQQFTFGSLLEDTKVDFQFNIFNVYGVYSGAWKQLNYQLGVRFEYSKRKLESLQNTELFTIFPSIHLSKPLRNNFDLKFSYSKRIRRPSVFDLSPIFLYSDNQVTWRGNPELTDAMVHSLEMGTNKTIETSTLSFDIFYRYVKNGWFRLLESVNDNQFINYPVETNNEQNIGMELMINWEISEKTGLNLGGSIFKQLLNNVEGIEDRNNISSEYNLTFNYKLSETLKFQIDGNYNGPQLHANSIITETYIINFLIQKQFFNKQLNVTLAFKDIAASDIYEQTYDGQNHENHSFWLQEYYPSSSQFFSISLRYSFSNYKAKKVKSNIQFRD